MSCPFDIAGWGTNKAFRDDVSVTALVHFKPKDAFACN